MGLAEVPTIILSGLSEAQKRALRIADNKIALNAGWDLEILQQELSELASIGAKPTSDFPAQTAYLNLVEKYSVRKDWMVGTTGEPLINEISSLQESEGEMRSLKRNGYFERRPHPLARPRKPCRAAADDRAAGHRAGRPRHLSDRLA